MKIFSLIFISLILTTGCAMYNYDVSIRNTGIQMITHASVQYDDFESVGGRVSPGASKTHLLPGYPIPEKAIVEWRTKDGKLHQKEVEVKKYTPKGFKGVIQFEINDNNEVKVRFIPD